MQEKRVEKIALCYSALTEVYHALLAYTAVFEPVGGNSKEQRRLKATAALDDFSKIFLPNKVFFPKHVGDQLIELRNSMISAFNMFLFSVELPKQSDTIKWLEISENLKGKTKNALSVLEGEFRRLLGDD